MNAPRQLPIILGDASFDGAVLYAANWGKTQSFPTSSYGDPVPETLGWKHPRRDFKHVWTHSNHPELVLSRDCINGLWTLGERFKTAPCDPEYNRARHALFGTRPAISELVLLTLVGYCRSM